MSEEKPSPISAAKPPIANPISPADGSEAATLKLKPVLRKPGTPAPALKIPTKPVVRTPAASAEPSDAPTAATMAPKSLDALKSVTQRLKDVTQEIPQQAILRKTGIISDQAMSEAQKQASKARTARISLSDAFTETPPPPPPPAPAPAPAASIGKPALMKTIRIKRPVDIPGESAPTKPAVTPAASPIAPAPTPAAPAAEAAAEEDNATSATITQRKTLKVSRPGAPKPGGKFSVKRPGSTAIPASPAPAAGGDGDVAEIPDIPDMPTTAPAPMPFAPAGEKDVPLAVNIFSLIVQVAACVAMGALGWMLYQNTLGM